MLVLFTSLSYLNYFINIFWIFFLDKKCDENMVYSTCASPCQPTCFNSTENMFCTGGCTESCICRPGFVMENGKCIKPETCGCLMPDGTYYTVNLFFLK